MDARRHRQVPAYERDRSDVARLHGSGLDRLLVHKVVWIAIAILALSFRKKPHPRQLLIWGIRHRRNCGQH